ncbi:MAG: hypothetical protein ACYC6I_11495 [Bacillota bacterium]
MDYPWYEAVKGSELRQGDIFVDCPTYAIRYSATGITSRELRGAIEVRDLILLTQSCDLDNAKVENVLLCPLYGIAEAVGSVPFLGSSDGLKDLMRGNIPGLHLLNEVVLPEHSELNASFIVVDLRAPVTVPLAYLQDYASDRDYRPRLLPPYREHLAQAFARFFMRVGLPINIDSSKIKREIRRP